MDFLEQCDTDRRAEEEERRLQKQRQEILNRLEILQQKNQQLTKEVFASPDCADLDHDIHQLRDILEIYRFTGTSLLPEAYKSKECFTLRFDPLYQNQAPSQDFYTLQLSAKGGKSVVTQHSLPPFIPLEEMEKNLLGEEDDIQGFVNTISSFLYSYTQRCEGLKHARREFADFISEEPEVDLPVTYVRLSVRVDEYSPAAHVTLQYTLDSHLPSTVEVDLETADLEGSKVSKKRLERLSEKMTGLLCGEPIFDALLGVVQLLKKMSS
ncbi:uncharacterized protein LOC128211057 [Mya arenaria]|uniref:uncharacterized protein LOC128211057 n=1 Tax=Mya arenaria TaxID=6604 RepID=UPI0022E61E24|nr:uncharacterized protein LOC128211057 [Mya arenaria]XP_052771417.1 uncharacterized protein LOC128211057 [Mya arenaria]